jgi:ribosomal protein L37AE/L43A
MRQASKVEEGDGGGFIVRGAAKDLLVQNNLAGAPVDSAVCDDCRHHHCQVCENHSAAKQYSDFWICHRCGELNRRVQNLDLKRGAS